MRNRRAELIVDVPARRLVQLLSAGQSVASSQPEDGVADQIEAAISVAQLVLQTVLVDQKAIDYFWLHVASLHGCSDLHLDGLIHVEVGQIGKVEDLQQF